MKNKNVYVERDRLVRELGLPSYRIYLQSELWAKIRKRVLKKKPRCNFCDARATQVHHSRYTAENLRGDCLRGLWSTCADCHELMHLNNGQMIDFGETHSRLKTFKKAHRKKLPKSRNKYRTKRKHNKVSQQA